MNANPDRKAGAISSFPIDLDRYRQRIGYAGPVDASLDVLSELIRLHRIAMPFENIEVLAGRVPNLDLAALQEKFVDRRRGGYCFEQNGLFMACLQQMGFVVERLAARVRAGVPADVMTGRTHLALRVRVDDVPYLVDVGFGPLNPEGPVRLDLLEEQAVGHGTFRLVPVGGDRADDATGDLLYQSRMDDQWHDGYLICHGVAKHIDSELGNWYVATHPKAMLRSNLLVSGARGALRMTLMNNRLTVRRLGQAGVEESLLTSRPEFADVLADGFGLVVASADLDAVMAVVERAAASVSPPL